MHTARALESSRPRLRCCWPLLSVCCCGERERRERSWSRSIDEASAKRRFSPAPCPEWLKKLVAAHAPVSGSPSNIRRSKHRGGQRREESARRQLRVLRVCRVVFPWLLFVVFTRAFVPVQLRGLFASKQSKTKTQTKGTSALIQRALLRCISF